VHLELQRLVARGPGGLPNRLVIDVGALLRHQKETDPTGGFWPSLLEAARRSHRDLMWVVAPPARGNLVVNDDLEKARQILLEASVANVVTCAQTLGSLLFAMATKRDNIGVVSAGLTERPYELWLLDETVTTMLDVASGDLWNGPSVAARFGAPAILPELYAIVRDAEEKGIGGNAAPRYIDGIRDVLEAKTIWDNAPVHSSVRTLVVSKQAGIKDRAAALRGVRDADTVAGDAFSAWLRLPVGTATAYVLARVTRCGDLYQVHSIEADVGSDRLAAKGDRDCAALLRSVVERAPDRWFVPHALDLLAAMIDLGIPLPRAAVDPGIVAFLLNPVEPPKLSELVPDLPLAPPLARWLGDVRRSASPPQTLRGLEGVLEEIDTVLATVSAAKGLTAIVENDIAKTLPVFAQMERMGAWIGTPCGHPGWASLSSDAERKLTECEETLRPVSQYCDIYSATYADLVGLLKNVLHDWLPAEYWSSDLMPKQEFGRYVALKHPVAVAVEEGRSIASPSGSHFWLKELARTSGQLRGVNVPQATGRWGLRELPLQNIPKRSSVGEAIRSGLVAPPGHVLVGADQNGFEVRLLADLSRDPKLLQAAEEPDVHRALAQLLFGSITREYRKRAKFGTYAILYGQTEDQFRRSRVDMPQSEAVTLYRLIQETFPTVFAFRDSTLDRYRQDGVVMTRGGWPIREDPKRRSRDAKERSVFNAVVQGLAADIQRWVLRELEVALKPFDARLAHQAHDELFVAVPETVDPKPVQDLVVDTMTNQVMHRSGLLEYPVKLVAVSHTGRTWADMI
jgi:hypothetical protein